MLCNLHISYMYTSVSITCYTLKNIFGVFIDDKNWRANLGSPWKWGHWILFLSFWKETGDFDQKKNKKPFINRNWRVRFAKVVRIILSSSGDPRSNFIRVENTRLSLYSVCFIPGTKDTPASLLKTSMWVWKSRIWNMLYSLDKTPDFFQSAPQLDPDPRPPGVAIHSISSRN